MPTPGEGTGAHTITLALILLSSAAAGSSSFTEVEGRSGERCYHKYVTVSVVKQVPSYSKHCTKVDDTKCKTVFKNAFTTQMETQCTPTFDTSCEPTIETAYRQQCKTIKDVECRVVNIEKYGKHHQKKICNQVPVQKCIPVPVKVEGQKCVNVPTQKCETVPVVASVPVPQKQCYKRPRKVCQTLVTTKPKVVTEQVPQEVCGHAGQLAHQTTRKAKAKGQGGAAEAPKKDLKVFAKGGLRPHLKEAGSAKVPIYEEPSINYKKQDIPLYEDHSTEDSEAQYYTEDYVEEEMEGYGSSPVQESVGFHGEEEGEAVRYDEYREREEARAAALHNYYKQLRGEQSTPTDGFFYQGEDLPYYEQVDRQFSSPGEQDFGPHLGPSATSRNFGPQFEASVDSLMGRVHNQVNSNTLEFQPSMKVETLLKFDDSQTFIAGDIADAATDNDVEEEERDEKSF